MSELQDPETSPSAGEGDAPQAGGQSVETVEVEATIEARDAIEVVSEPPAAARELQPEPPRPTRARIPWWPFLMYLGVWIGSMGAAGWIFAGLPEGIALYGSDPYAHTVLAGVGLTVVGPAIAVVVWLVLYARAAPGSRHGLLSGSLFRGALVTLVGVAVWWGMLIGVDMARLGRPW